MKELAEIVTDALVERETRIRQGKVTSIQAGPPRTITVNISGTDYPNIRCMSHVNPVVAENVWMLDMGIGRWLIFGTTSNSLTRTDYVKLAGDTMTGTLTVPTVVGSSQIQLPTGGNSLIFGTDGSYLSFHSAGFASRRGYLQGNAAGVILSSESGALSLAGSGGLNLSGGRVDFGSQAIQSLTSIGMNGSISFANANPSITASSYITMSGGLFVSGGTLYSGAVIQARGGIYNDSGAGAPGVRINGDGSGYASGWTQVQLQVMETSGAQHCAISLYNGPGAPIIRTYGPFGELFDFLNNPNTNYVALRASAFTVTTSSRDTKIEVREAEDEELLRIASELKTHRYKQSIRPQTLRPTERFKDIAARWVAMGHSPLSVSKNCVESCDHDCSVDECTGTTESPCMITLNDTHRWGFMAEHVAAATNEPVWVDEEGKPNGYDAAQIAALAFGGVGALLRRIEVLEARLQILEPRTNGSTNGHSTTKEFA